MPVSAGMGTPKRSTWIRSDATPAASNAASASSFIMNGPQMNAWSMWSATIRCCRNSPSFARSSTPWFSGESTRSSENTWCSDTRVT